MRANSLLLAVLATVGLTAQEWRVATPGYEYQFPRDHFSHPDFQTEWWYYTGNLRASDGHRFGFELTFFRQAEHLTAQQMEDTDTVWRPDQIYLAHLALSDIDGQQFFHTERLNRPGPGLAGAALADQKYWNGNWQSKWISLTTGEQELQAVTDKLSLKLRLTPQKPFVINGDKGISRKGPLPGEASHYITCTRLAGVGKLHWDSRDYTVSGLAWMDHEFFSGSSDNDLAGWDWFAIQLDNRQELMLYRLRSKSGGDRFSSGTFVAADGRSRYLDASQFHITPLTTWHSNNSGATYPVSWRISVPCVALELTEKTALPNQELFDANGVSPTYWEGAVTYDGTQQKTPLHGLGYLEMTGYARMTRDLASP
jgi:predicted secreted hydrolase